MNTLLLALLLAASSDQSTGRSAPISTQNVGNLSVVPKGYSAGATLATHLSGWWNVTASGVKCDGSTNDTAALGSAAGIASASGVGLLIPCKVRIASAAGSITVPVRFEGGGSFDLQTGGSVALSSEVVSGLHQIFYMNGGSVTFGTAVREVYPQWWGAKGDGVNDDALAINDARWAVASSGGGTIFYPAGTYKITKPIHLDNYNYHTFLYSGSTATGVFHVGAGMNLTTIKPSGFWVSAFTTFPDPGTSAVATGQPWSDLHKFPPINSANDPIVVSGGGISNMTVDMDYTTNPDGGALYGPNYGTYGGTWPNGTSGASNYAADNFEYPIFIQWSRNFEIKGMRLRRTWYDGIELYGVQDFLVHDNIIENAGDRASYIGNYAGIEIDNSSTRVDIHHNIVKNCGYGMQASGANGSTAFNAVSAITVTGNTFDTTVLNGMYIFDWHDGWKIQGNTFKNIGLTGIQLAWPGASATYHPQNCTISDNTIEEYNTSNQASVAAINVFGSGNKISGNHISQLSSSVTANTFGIQVQDTGITLPTGAARGVHVQGNDLVGRFPGVDTNTAAILAGNQNAVVEGNTIVSSASVAQTAIRITASGVNVKHNTIQGNWIGNQLTYGSGSSINVQDQLATTLGASTSALPLATLAVSGTSGGSTGFQMTLDTGDSSTYGTFRLGHFTNGSFFGTYAGSNTASDLIRFGTNGSTVLQLDHAGNTLVSGTKTIDVLTAGTLSLGTSTATAVTVGSGSAVVSTPGGITSPSVDKSGGSLTLGANTTSTAIGKSGTTTTVSGALSVAQNTTLTGTLTVGTNGVAVSANPRGTATLATSAISANLCAAEQSVTVTGATTGAECLVGMPSTIEVGLIWSCYVSAANTAKLRVCNHTAGSITPAGSQTVSIRTLNP